MFHSPVDPSCRLAFEAIVYRAASMGSSYVPIARNSNSNSTR
jgi:hypothetical protein